VNAADRFFLFGLLILFLGILAGVALSLL